MVVVRHLAGVAVGGDDGGDEGGDPHGVGAGVRVVAVELDQVVDGQHDADQVHEDPQEVDDVVTEWSLGNRASNGCLLLLQYSFKRMFITTTLSHLRHYQNTLLNGHLNKHGIRH